MSGFKHITRQPCYAFYRLPDSKSVQALCAESAESVPGGLAAVSGREGFLVSPYSAADHTPLFIPAEESRRFHVSTLPVRPLPPQIRETSGRDAYTKAFGRAMMALRDERCDKIVLARKVHIQLLEDTLDALDVFGAACRAYPKNYVALWHTPQSGTWITATPELLLSHTPDGNGHTMALAGTMPAAERGAHRLAGWSRKNRKEQEMVVCHVARQLKAHDIDFQTSYTRPSPSGGLLHLRTDFHFSDCTGLPALLEDLHPTPAVCGMPIQAAQKELLTFEGMDREYYAGYSGPTHADGTFAFYVTLRCMHQVGQGFDLYAGSGLLPQSTEAGEWQETESKLDALRQVINGAPGS